MRSILVSHTIASFYFHVENASSCNVGGLVFPGSFMHKKDKDGKAVMAGEPRDLFTEANFRKFERSWDDGRIQTAFFRGEISLNSDTLLIEFNLSHMMHSINRHSNRRRNDHPH